MYASLSEEPKLISSYYNSLIRSEMVNNINIGGEGVFLCMVSRFRASWLFPRGISPLLATAQFSVQSPKSVEWRDEEPRELHLPIRELVRVEHQAVILFVFTRIFIYIS